jgi:hypothetical protein
LLLLWRLLIDCFAPLSFSQNCAIFVLIGS